jgi:hypothetical protein
MGDKRRNFNGNDPVFKAEEPVHEVGNEVKEKNAEAYYVH